MLISLRDVSVRYGAALALDHVGLEVRAGDFVTIVGPNGAGKTTLLRVLLGLESPVGGQVIKSTGLRIGYVPQRLPLNPSMPMPVARFLTMGNAFSQARLGEIVRQVRVEGIMEHPVSGLSGGEMQRVLLARALLREPQLLVLDEPAQNLDMAGQMEFYDLLDAYHARANAPADDARDMGAADGGRGCAVVMVSHDLHLVMARTTRVICLYRHVCCEGAPMQVAQDPNFARAMGPEVARLLAGYVHRHDHGHLHDHAPQAACHSHDNLSHGPPPAEKTA